MNKGHVPSIAQGIPLGVSFFTVFHTGGMALWRSSPTEVQICSLSQPNQAKGDITPFSSLSLRLRPIKQTYIMLPKPRPARNGKRTKGNNSP